MQYSRLVRDAWALTWRHRFLWIFAIFGGANGGSCGGGFNGSDFSGDLGDAGLPGGDDLEQVGRQIGDWVVANIGLIVAVAAVLALLVIALAVVSFIARGALIASTARLALGEPTTTSQGWALGRRFAWRYVRLTILLLLVGLVIALFLILVALVFVAMAAISQVLAVVLGILVGLAAVLGLIALAIALSVAIAYAERAIALDDLGARASLRRGVALVRLRTVESLALWLISLVIGIVTAIVFIAVALVLLIPLGGLGVAAYLTSGLGAETLLIALFGLIVFISVLWFLGAIAGTFASGFWTLAYLSLTQRYPPDAAAPAGTDEPAAA
jgi:hypothetical protein